MGKKWGAFALVVVGLLAAAWVHYGAEWVSSPLALKESDLLLAVGRTADPRLAQQLFFNPVMFVVPMVLLGFFSLFSMWNGRSSRWVPFAYSVLLALGVGWAIVADAVTSNDDSVDTGAVVLVAAVAALILLGVAILSLRQRAWFGAVIGVVAAVAAGLSGAYAIVDQMSNGSRAFEPVVWLLPVGYAAAAIGCVLAIRAGRAERSTPQTPASPRNETGVEPGVIG